MFSRTVTKSSAPAYGASGHTISVARLRSALRRTPVSVWNDDLSDWAAALTYYAMLALLPALLVTVTLVGTTYPAATEALIADITAFAPAESGTALRGALEEAAEQDTAIWLLTVTGAGSAVWAASSYLAVFRRALHAMHRVADARPALRRAHVIVVTAAGLLVLLVASALALVLTGPLARWAGRVLGLGQAGTAAWAVLKWPFLLVLVSCLIMVVFRSGPKVPAYKRHALPGGVLAALLWLAASAGFALYATQFGTYSRVYGSLAGVVVFLVWVWFTNLALLAGAQFNAELARLGDEGTGHRRSPDLDQE